MSAKYLDPRNIIQLNEETGCMERINIETGEVQPLEVRLDEGSQVLENYVYIKSSGDSRGGVLVHKDAPISDVRKVIQKSYMPYNYVTAAYICDELSRGRTLVDICKEEGMPSVGTVYRWRAMYPEFKDMYNSAKAASSEVYFDKAQKAIEGAEEYTESINLADKKARFYMQAAKVKNPSDYGEVKKINNEGGGGTPVIIVQTGIDRSERPVVEAPKVDALEAGDNTIEVCYEED